LKQDADIVKLLTERGIELVKIGVFDTDGIMRGKYLSRDKFLAGLEKNLGFCDVILGWDSSDQLYDNTKFTGWHTAPTAAAWGVENRTTAIRVIRGGPSSHRIEYRIAAADINPYIALAAAIGSGLWGIENRIEPDAPIEGNAYDREHPPHRRLPATLFEAAERLLASKPARALFGDEFVEHYAATRQWEEREFRKAITDWELARYFEII
jgi:glutamine synthetase